MMMSNDKPVNLFEDVDLKNIKAEIVPAKTLYLNTLKWSLYICFTFWATFSLYSALYELNSSGNLLDFIRVSIVSGLFIGIIAAGIPCAVISSYIWKYEFFKHAISNNLKHGEDICRMLRKYLSILLLLLAFIHIVSFFIIILSGGKLENVSVFALIHNNISFALCFYILNSIFRMELIRLGAPSILNNVNNLLSMGKS